MKYYEDKTIKTMIEANSFIWTVLRGNLKQAEEDWSFFRQQHEFEYEFEIIVNDDPREMESAKMSLKTGGTIREATRKMIDKCDSYHGLTKVADPSCYEVYVVFPNCKVLLPQRFYVGYIKEYFDETGSSYYEHLFPAWVFGEEERGGNDNAE